MRLSIFPPLRIGRVAAIFVALLLDSISRIFGIVTVERDRTEHFRSTRHRLNVFVHADGVSGVMAADCDWQLVY